MNLPIHLPNRASLISSILRQREPMQKRIDQTCKDLEELQGALAQAETKRADLLAQVELDDVKNGLQGIDFRRIWVTIDQELKALEKLRRRFGRKTLNIGVIGRARQGKSRLLQSLTGLSAQEIPDSDGGHCTGVKSSIVQHAGETSATVIFHDSKSFLKKISIYYKALDLGDCPSTIESFALSPLATLPQSKTLAADEEKYRHLKQYKENLATYRTLIGQDPKAIKAGEIRQYVAQHTLEEEQIYSYLAVKEVLIYCDFPNPDVGQISVIDMPGLGDTGIGDKERMIETLGESVDFVLFVKKPHEGTWYDSDIDLYDTASAALVDLPIKQWSFMVLNRTEDSSMGDNSRYCKILYKTVEEKSIHVSQTIVANCSKSDEVNNLILDPLLNYMLANIERLDRQYAQTCQQRVNAIRAEVEVIVTAANTITDQLPNDDDSSIFADRFDDFWESLAISLDEMLYRLKSTRKQQDPHFETVVEQVLAECRERPKLPKPERIEKVQKERGDWAGTQGQLMHETRNHLSKAFSEIEVGLKPCIDEVKREIYQVLKRECLGELAPGYENAAYLQQVALKIPQDCPDLKLAFDQLSNFELLYRGFIQHRIRKHLDALTPDLTQYRYNPHQIKQIDNGFMGLGMNPQTVPLIETEQVQLNLERAYDQALTGCEDALTSLLDEPSLAAFSIAEEFVDRILHAQNTRREFRSFLSKYRKDVWPETFNQSAQLRTIALNWKTAVNTIEPFQGKTRYQFA